MRPPASRRRGTWWAGKFVVERVIGVGGMGVVVAAHHQHLEQTVAIKFLRRDAAKDEMAVSRFLREARAAIALQSEHVVRVMDAGRLDDGLPYLVMEYLSGLDLDQVLAQRGRLPLAEAVEYLLQAMEAVADAHAAGIVHRDLKPSNLFVTTRADGSPHVKVLDFGISKAFDAARGAKQPSLTVTSMTLGSPLYMSPEQVRSSKTVDARTDVWALGVIAYELLAGVQPFEAETVTGLCAKIVADEPVPLRSIRPDVPAAFEAVVLKCLEKSPAARYQSVIRAGGGAAAFCVGRRPGVGRADRAHRRSAEAHARQRPERVSQPRPRPRRRASRAPSDADLGYAETVASWQGAETAREAGQDRRSGHCRPPGDARRWRPSLAKWPRAAAPSPVPPAAVSAATVADLPARSVDPAALPPRLEAVPSAQLAEAARPEPPPPASAPSARPPPTPARRPASPRRRRASRQEPGRQKTC